MKNTILLLALVTILISCSESDVNKSDVKIRLANTSHYDYENIIINTSTGDVNFGELKSGNSSDYKVFETAYRYAYVELEINGNILRIQPIDYVGETPLKNGNYTYEIHTNSSNEEYGALSIELVVD